jgi:hypothetical protein
MTDNYCGLLTDGCVYQILKRQSEGEKYWILDHERSGQKSSYLAPKESQFRKATTEEISSHLISEAEKKGFVKGAKVKAKGRNTRNCYSHQDFTLQDRQWYSDISGEIEEVRISKCNNVVIRLKSDVTLFLEASSFELIPSHPLIQIGKYQVEFKEDFITVGCKSINAPKIINLKKAIKEWNDCSSEVIRSLDIQGNTVTVEQIEEIAKHYSK